MVFLGIQLRVKWLAPFGDSPFHPFHTLKRSAGYIKLLWCPEDQRSSRNSPLVTLGFACIITNIWGSRFWAAYQQFLTLALPQAKLIWCVDFPHELGPRKPSRQLTRKRNNKYNINLLLKLKEFHNIFYLFCFYDYKSVIIAAYKFFNIYISFI